MNVRRIAGPILAVILLTGLPARAAIAGTDRWTTTGPPGARVNSVAVVPLAPSTVFASVAGRSFGSGVYKSTDAGRRWNMANARLEDLNVNDLAVAPSSADVAYAGTYGSGVHRTVDGGASWSPAWDMYETEIDALAVDPADPKTVYAGASYIDEPPSWNFYKTTNGGKSWIESGNGLPYPIVVHALAIDPVTPSTVYAGTGGDGVYRSLDGGATWSPANEGMGDVSIQSLAIDPQDPLTLYAGRDQYVDPQGSGLYKTTDGGATWIHIDDQLLRHFSVIFDIVVDPVTPSTLYASTQDPDSYAPGGVLKSTDGGETWVTASTGLFDLYVADLSIDPSAPGTLYAAGNAGVFKTTDGAATWTPNSVGMLGTEVISLATDPADPSAVYAGTTTAGVFRSTSNGRRWSPARSGLSATWPIQALAVDPFAPATVYAGTQGGGVYKTSDAGTTWSLTSSGLRDRNVLALALDPVAEGVAYAGTLDGVYKTTDGAANWSAVYRPPATAIIYTVVTDPATSGTAYIGIVSSFESGVFKTVDGGENWALANDGIPAVTRSLAIDPLDADVLYAGVECQGIDDPCVYKTTDGAATWQPMSGGFTGTIVSGLAIDPVDDAIVYASGYFFKGVYRTSNGGASWSSFHEGLKNDSVQAIAMDAVTGATVYIGTFGSGVFDLQP
jgi:photosystem II stability/assembly factor-like uncharacterized protein